MENDPVAEPSTTEWADGPTLPPRPISPTPTEDVWVGVEQEPEHLHHLDHHAEPPHEQRFLLPTTFARAMTAVGWAGGSATTVALLAALMPYFREGETRNFRLSLHDERLFAALLIGSALLVYVGWAWWSISAAFNSHRLVALGTSPWLPTLVYFGGPVIVLVGADRSDWVGDVIVGVGCCWIGIGHLVVVASMRTTAGRIRASVDEFSKVFWLPLAWVAYRMFANTMLTFVDDGWRSPWLLFGIGAVSALFPLALSVATWHASGTFDAACRRLNTRSLGFELPSTDMITAAIRQRALEGR